MKYGSTRPAICGRTGHLLVLAERVALRLWLKGPTVELVRGGAVARVDLEGTAMNPGKSELAALTRMFSAAVIRELGRSGRSALFARLLAQSGLGPHLPLDATVGDVFNHAFRLLRSLGNRDEYVYRSAITQKILLGQHNLRTASMLSEARVGMCKADVVVLNGTSTAYEIKSERDSLARLTNQVTSYGEVFAAVNVVTSPSHVKQVFRQIPGWVGVLVLSEKFTLQVERPAVVNAARTNPLAVLDLMRVDEAHQVLRSLDIAPPHVPNTQMRGALCDLYRPLDPTAVHTQMVATLKITRSQGAASDFIKTVPMSLRTAMLSVKMNGASEKRVLDATRLPVSAAFAWS
ncbi:sce7726 family protein [Plantibacter sp. PA-3-X8]|uniref:sce7726 family protein n=1 Tax=Plantibacter sp. PA-3-X8 TaxID=2480625 RepID=UPI0019D1326B|nr:sce7726 family protein [Plantibacter sp. PA-3-X8]